MSDLREVCARLDGGLVLETEHDEPVMFRRLTAADAGPFAEHVAGDLARLSVHLRWPAVTATVDGARTWLEPYEQSREGRVLAAGAWHEDRVLGGALLFRHAPEDATIELGCWVTAQAEGRGLARACCRALLLVARRDLKAERVEWRAATDNARSRRLAERLGFRHEGTLRSNYALRGERLDSDVFSLVGPELDASVEGS
jgi:ribosomal-protein-serine acetyltransferase